ncbi:MAG: class I SAM-dependent methyltransferase [Ilumatobacter sp.]|uniref:class I SAM-dependent DNA methyltransferase n=1 Tax=Ilumatobacter sp. TaxID=1967498 RepID=UPI003299743C
MTHDDGLARQLAASDQHTDPAIAAGYDSAAGAAFTREQIQRTADVLTELADGGPAVEFAIGTGRIALPLTARGVTVSGMDISERMLAELRSKPGADAIDTIVGDMTSTVMRGDASLVYLVYNTIGNLRTQAQQVACFRNAAAHLRPGGRFVIETGVPKLHQLPPGQTIRPFAWTDDHLGFDEYVDSVGQILVSHHYRFDGDRVDRITGAFRYVWPSELDLMAQLAEMEFESRWADWDRSEFTADSPSHVSVWRLT